MVANGHYVLILALGCAFYSVFASVLGARKDRDDLIRSGENALFGVTILLSLAMLLLLKSFLAHDFHNEYVASYSNRAMPTFYVAASLWGGQQGSLLFWGWILSLYAALTVYMNRYKNRQLMPYVVATLMAGAFFFILLNVFISQPFSMLWQLSDGRVVGNVVQPANSMAFIAADGRGLNPLLQHPAMVIHPPILYLGFVGFSIPFAFAIAALISGKLDNQWLKTIRRWTIVPWFFLGMGMLLGGKWAYMELGWGGYWAWDPVENAALMPWLVGTAFIHSTMIQEKKNMLRVWNMVLILLTYTLCIFGTFITRSGVISSVHSFALSNIGPFFAGYIGLIVLVSIVLVVKRVPALRTTTHFDAVVSRESAFLMNNFVFLIACLAVLWGTVFPIVSEAVRGVKVTVAEPFFNSVMVPIGLFLLFLTGVGPLVAWRKTSSKFLKKIFLLPTLVALAGLGVLFLLGIRHFYALLSFALAIFVTATIVAEYHRGAIARMKSHGENYALALWRLLQRNKRRYGGYIVHFGMVVLFIGFTGRAFHTEKEQHLKPGEAMQVRNYKLVYTNFSTMSDPNKIVWQAEMNVFKDGKRVDTIYPNKHFYRVQEQPTTEVVLHQTLLEDLYVVLAQPNEDKSAIFKVYINPLVNWVWIAGFIVVIGTFVILLPDPKVSGQKVSQREQKRRRPVQDGVA